MAESSQQRVGVIGWPVSHSLSPRLHGYWIRQYGINAEYAALPVQPQELFAVIDRLAAEGWKGFNLTIPHKEAVMVLLDEVEESAKRVGAVNTVILKNNTRIGRNTDIEGFWENVRPHVKNKNKAVVLGAGGAARAVVEALQSAGFAQIIVANRSRTRADALPGNKAILSSFAWEDRSAALVGADLLVNTTSLGMTGKEALDIDLALLPKSAVVNDIVYSPLMTSLLLSAKERGNVIVDGLGMLLYQAVPAFEAWFGVRPSVTPELRAYILEGK